MPNFSPTLAVKPLVTAISFITFAMSSTVLVGCASQPTATKQPLYQSVLKANQGLVGRESYAFDYRVNFVRPPLRLTEVQPSPNRQKLANEFFTTAQLTPAQQALINEGMKHKAQQDIKSEQYVDAFIKRFEMASSGVMDLGRGQVSIVPEFRYVQNNAGAFIKVPLAADFARSKIYADLSVLSEFATDPTYDGRYVEYDYSKLLKGKKIDGKALFNVFQQFSLLTPTLAKESDYQALPLSADDRQKGITQRIGYKTSYHQMIASYLLFFYVNENYFKSLFDKADFEKSKELKQLGALSVTSPLSLVRHAFDSTTLSSADEKAYESAARLYGAIEQMREAQTQYEDEDSPTESATSQDSESVLASTVSYIDEVDGDEATQASNAEDLDNENSDSPDNLDNADTEEPDDSDVATLHDALTAFEQYKSNQFITAAELAKIINDNPQAFTKLQTAIIDKAPDMLSRDDQVSMNYGLNSRHQLINVTALTSLPNLDKNRAASSKLPTGQFQTVMNFYDYGKARVNPAIFSNAVSWEQVSKDNNLMAASQKAKEFDSSKNLEALAYSLVKQNKNFVDTFVTLYTYQYLLDKDEESLSDVDMAALKQTATALAMRYADYYEVPVNTDNAPEPIEAYEESIDAEHVAGVTYTAYQNQKYIQQAQRLRAQGQSTAQIFTQLYNTLADATADSDTTAVTAASAAASVAESYYYSSEQNACAILLDTDKLDSKSLKSLTKICDKIDKATQAEYDSETSEDSYETTATTVVASAAVPMSEADIAKQQQARDSFNRLLGEIAAEDMQTQANNMPLSDDNDTLIQRLQPHFEASYDFDYDTYKKAYQILLLSQ